MPSQDPNIKSNIVNSGDENSFDDDNKVTNNDNPVREGQENSSILADEATVGDTQLEMINNYEKYPHQMEEWIDTDKVNFKPEDK